MGYKALLYTIGWLAKLRVKSLHGIEHLPQTGPAIIASNHASWFDPLTFGGGILPHFHRIVYYVAITANWKWLGALPIDPAHPGDILRAAQKQLTQGEVVGIYPEGYRNGSDKLPKGKTGVARLAHWTGAPVVPVGIRSRPGTHLAEIVRNVQLHRSTTIHVGAPLHFAKKQENEITETLLRETTATIMSRIANLSGKTYPYEHP